MVKIVQKSVPAGLKSDKDLELNGLNRVILTAAWTRGGVEQSRKLEFYVYRAG